MDGQLQGLDNLPQFWAYGVKSDGRIFFINDRRGITTWLHPVYERAAQSGHITVPDLPTGFECGVTPEGALYYIDHKAWTTSFDHPNLVDEEGHLIHQAPPRVDLSSAGQAGGPNTYQQHLSHSSSTSRSPTTPGPMSPIESPPAASNPFDVTQRQMSERKSQKQKVVRKPPGGKRSPTSVVSMHGWIYRLENRSWKHRWCVLVEFCLYFYKDEEEKSETGSVLLPSYEVNFCVPQDNMNRRCTFKTEHVNLKTSYFACSNTDERECWMKAMTLASIAKRDPRMDIENNNNYRNRWPQPVNGDWKTVLDPSHQLEQQPSLAAMAADPWPEPEQNVPQQSSSPEQNQSYQMDPFLREMEQARRSGRKQQQPQQSSTDPHYQSAGLENMRRDPHYHGNPNIPLQQDSHLHQQSHDYPSQQSLVRDPHPSLTSHNSMSPDSHISLCPDLEPSQLSVNDSRRNLFEPVRGSYASGRDSSGLRDLHPPKEWQDPSSPHYPRTSTQNDLRPISTDPMKPFQPLQEKKSNAPMMRNLNDNTPRTEQLQGKRDNRDIAQDLTRQQQYLDPQRNIADPSQDYQRPHQSVRRPLSSEFEKEIRKTGNRDMQMRDDDQRSVPYGDVSNISAQRDPRDSLRSQDPRASFSGQDPRASYSGQDPRASYRDRDPRASYSGQDPRSSYTDRDPRASYSDRDPRASYSDRDPRASYTDRDPRASFADVEGRPVNQHRLSDRDLRRVPDPRTGLTADYSRPNSYARELPLDVDKKYPTSNYDQKRPERYPSDPHPSLHDPQETLHLSLNLSDPHSMHAQRHPSRQPLLSSRDGRPSNPPPLPPLPTAASISIIQQDPSSHYAQVHRKHPSQNQNLPPRDQQRVDRPPVIPTSSENQKYNFYDPHPTYVNLKADPRYDMQNNQVEESLPERPPLPGEIRQQLAAQIASSQTPHTSHDQLMSIENEHRRMNEPNAFHYPSTGGTDRSERGRYPPGEAPDPYYAVPSKPIGSPPIQRHAPSQQKQLSSMSTVKEDPTMLDTDILETKHVFDKYPLSGTRLRLSLNAETLLGKTHEELVLLLIQLRRNKAGLENARDFYRHQLERRRPSELEYQRRINEGPIYDPILEEEHHRYAGLKRQNEDIEKKLEVYKPLINLVDNMVTMGSLYGGDNYMLATQYKKHLLQPQEYTPPRRMLEFSRQRQEDRMMEDLENDIKQLSLDEVDLDDRMDRLHDLDKLLQEQSAMVISLKEDQDLLERTLSDIRNQEGYHHNNPREMDRLMRQQHEIERELSRVMQQLADASQKLEATSVETNTVEREVALLRSKVHGDLNRSKSAPSSSGDNKAKIEKDLARVQGLMTGLSDKGAQLSKAMNQIRRSSAGLPADMDLSDHEQSPPQKHTHQKNKTYVITDLDTNDSWNIADMTTTTTTTTTTSMEHIPPPDNQYPSVQKHDPYGSVSPHNANEELRNVDPYGSVSQQNAVHISTQQHQYPGQSDHDEIHQYSARDSYPQYHAPPPPIQQQSMPQTLYPEHAYLDNNLAEQTVPQDKVYDQEVSHLTHSQGELDISHASNESGYNNESNSYNSSGKIDGAGGESVPDYNDHQQHQHAHAEQSYRRTNEPQRNIFNRYQNTPSSDPSRHSIQKSASLDNVLVSNQNTNDDETMVKSIADFHQDLRSPDDDSYRHPHHDRLSRTEIVDRAGQQRDEVRPWESAPQLYPGDLAMNSQQQNRHNGNRYLDHDESVYIPAREEELWDIGDADDNTKRFYGLIPKEKAKTLTVRDVKRQSEQRRERDKSQVQYDDDDEAETLPNEWSWEKREWSLENDTDAKLGNYYAGDGVFKARYAQVTPVQKLTSSFEQSSNLPVYENLPNSMSKSAPDLSVSVYHVMQDGQAHPEIQVNRKPSIHVMPQRLLGPKPFTPYRETITVQPARIAQSIKPVSSEPKFSLAKFISEHPDQLNTSVQSDASEKSPTLRKSFLRDDGSMSGIIKVRKSPRKGSRYMTISSSQPLTMETPSEKADIMNTAAGDLIQPVDMVPDIVRSSTAFKANLFDAHVIEREVLARPKKVSIPERYIPDDLDDEEMTVEEKSWRQERSERIRKVLTNQSVQELSQSDRHLPGRIHDQVEQTKRDRKQVLSIGQELAREVSRKSREAAETQTDPSASHPPIMRLFPSEIRSSRKPRQVIQAKPHRIRKRVGHKFLFLLEELETFKSYYS